MSYKNLLRSARSNVQYINAGQIKPKFAYKIVSLSLGISRYGKYDYKNDKGDVIPNQNAALQANLDFTPLHKEVKYNLPNKFQNLDTNVVSEMIEAVNSGELLYVCFSHLKGNTAWIDVIDEEERIKRGLKIYDVRKDDNPFLNESVSSKKTTPKKLNREHDSSSDDEVQVDSQKKKQKLN